MPCYAYNPALRAPGKWSGINFADTKLKQALELMTRGLNEKVSNFEVSNGINLTKQQFVSEDGAQIPCYIFEPEDKTTICGNMLYCHGGGFFLPIQPMMMQLADTYARELSIRVYIPEYRILPDYTNPSQFWDCLALLKNILEQDLPYILYGESIGGTLVAGLSTWVRDNGKKKANAQCLVYPALDNSCSKYSSMRQYCEAAWPLRNNLTMWIEYLKNGPKIPIEYLIPMKATDFHLLPKTYIEPQEIDILRDEAIEYAKKLEESEVCVKLNMISGSYHGFDEDFENPFVKAVIQERIAFMKQMLI